MFSINFEKHEYPMEEWKTWNKGWMKQRFRKMDSGNDIIDTNGQRTNLLIDTERPPVFAVKQISDDLYGSQYDDQRKTHLFEDGIRGGGDNVDLGVKLPRVKILASSTETNIYTEIPGFFLKFSQSGGDDGKNGAIRLSDLFNDKKEVKIPLYRYLGFGNVVDTIVPIDVDNIPIHELELLLRGGGKLPGPREKLRTALEEISSREPEKFSDSIIPYGSSPDTITERGKIEEKIINNFKAILENMDNLGLDLDPSDIMRDLISDGEMVEEWVFLPCKFYVTKKEIKRVFKRGTRVFKENAYATDFIRNHLLTSTLIHHGLKISDKTYLDKCAILHTLRVTALSEVLKFIHELETRYEFNFGDLDPSRIAIRFIIHEVTSGGVLMPYYGDLVEDVVGKILIWHPVPYFDFTKLGNISGSITNGATGGSMTFTSRINGRNRQATLIDKIFDTTLKGRFSTAIDSLDKDFSGLQGNNVPTLITRLMYITGLVYDVTQFRHLFYLLYLDQTYIANLKKSGSFKFLDEHVWGETNNALVGISNTLSKARGQDARLLNTPDKEYIKESELDADFFLSFPTSTATTNYLMNGSQLADELMRVNRQILEGWRKLNDQSKLCIHNSFYRGDLSLLTTALASSTYVSGVGNITKRGKVPITLENNAVLSLLKNSNNIRQLMVSKTNDNDWWEKLMSISNMPMDVRAWPIITKMSITGDRSLIAAGKGGGEIYIVARPRKTIQEKDKQDSMSAYMWLKYIHNLYEFMTADSPEFDIYKLPGMFLEFEADVRTKLLDYAGQLQEVTISGIKSSIEKWFDYVSTILIHLRTDYDIKVRKELTALKGNDETVKLLEEHEKIYLVFTVAMDMISTLRHTILHTLNIILYEYLRLPPISTPIPMKGIFGMSLSSGGGGGGGGNTTTGLVSDLLRTIPDESKYKVAMDILGKLPLVQEEASTYENVFKVYQTALMFSSTVEKRTEVTELFDKHMTRLTEIDEKVTTLEVRALSVVSSIERATRLSTIVTRTVRKTMSIYDILSFIVPKLPTNVDVWVVNDASSIKGERVATITKGIAEVIAGDSVKYTPLYTGDLKTGLGEGEELGEVTELSLDKLVQAKNGKLVEVKNPLIDPEQYELLALKTFPVEPHSNKDSLEQQLLHIRENQDRINEYKTSTSTFHMVHGELKTSETQTEVLISLMASKLYTEGISPHFVEVTGAFTMNVGVGSYKKNTNGDFTLESDATDAATGEKWSPLTILRRILQGEENILDIARDVNTQANGGDLMKKTKDIYEIIGEKTEVIDNNINLIISLISEGSGSGTAAANIDGTQSFIVMELIDRDMSKMRDVYELLYKNVYVGLVDDDVPSYSECVENAVQQVVIALSLFQHELKGMHRDLHPGNVFVKICDTKEFHGRLLKDIPRLETRIGRTTYSVPNLGFICKLADYGLSTISWESPDHIAKVDIQTDYVSQEKGKVYFDPLRDMPTDSVVSHVIKEYVSTQNLTKFFSIISSINDSLVKKRIAALIENKGSSDILSEKTGFIYTLSSLFIDVVPASIAGVLVIYTLEAANSVVEKLKVWVATTVADAAKGTWSDSIKSMLKIIAVAGAVSGIAGAASWLTSLTFDSVVNSMNTIISGLSTLAETLGTAGSLIGTIGSLAGIWKWVSGNNVATLFDWAVGITATSLVGKALIPFLWEKAVDGYIVPLFAAKLKIPEQVDQLFKPVNFRKTRRYTPGYDIATFFNGVANNPHTWTSQTLKYYYEMERAEHVKRFGTDEHVQFYQINDPKYTFPIHTMGNNVVSHFYPDPKWTVVSPINFLQRMVEITVTHGERSIYVSVDNTPSYRISSLSSTIGNPFTPTTTTLTCQWCNIREAKFVCTVCEKSIYCSEECSSDDWSHCGTHSYSCIQHS